MNFQLINNLLWTGAYLAYGVWIILAIALLTGLIKRKWSLVKRALKYIINSIVFIIAWMFILELALIVRPPIRETKQASIIALQNWIHNTQIEDIYGAFIVTILLLSINILFYYKVDNRSYKRDLLILTLSDITVLSLGIWLTGQHAYFGLMLEINRHFS